MATNRKCSIGLNHLRIRSPKLERYRDLRVIPVAPEPAVFTGEGCFDGSVPCGLPTAPVIVDGLSFAVRMKIKVDPATFRHPSELRHIAFSHDELDLGCGVGREREGHGVLPGLLGVGGGDEAAEHVAQQAGAVSV